MELGWGQKSVPGRVKNICKDPRRGAGAHPPARDKPCVQGVESRGGGRKPPKGLSRGVMRSDLSRRFFHPRGGEEAVVLSR